MNLEYVEFYQSVRSWNNREIKTIAEGASGDFKDVKIVLEDHLVRLSCEGCNHLIIVPTSNVRYGKLKSVETVIKERLEKAKEEEVLEITKFDREKKEVTLEIKKKKNK